MQAKQFFALLFWLSSQLMLLFPEVQSNTNAQQYKNKQIADAIAILFKEALNDVRLLYQKKKLV